MREAAGADPVSGTSSRNTTDRRQAAEAPAAQRPVSSLRDLERRHRELSKRQKELEQQIHSVEERMHELTAALAGEECYRDGTARDLSLEYDQLNTNLAELYSEWEQVCEKVLEVESELEDIRP